jgi:ElaB/YqjD/DUF883 family membrane-anchored ribosome-binding protein
MAWGKSSNRGGGGGCLAALALLVALAALFVAWSAYQRTGGTFGQLTRGVKSLDRPFDIGEIGNTDWKGALDKARERLQEHRPEVEDQRNLEQVRRDVAQIRESLEHAFHGTGTDAKEKWRGLDGDMQKLEAQLREGGSKARATFDEVLEKMKR